MGCMASSLRGICKVDNCTPKDLFGSSEEDPGPQRSPIFHAPEVGTPSFSDGGFTSGASAASPHANAVVTPASIGSIMAGTGTPGALGRASSASPETGDSDCESFSPQVDETLIATLR
ncbi:unnamed protein product [Polarella glacialis]|uniref:Uncharacterized protein n=1 Tax=Polarella glacialis TaxID=89957 RepID=A0A813IJJ8_POLGL|nr:unnamed protein product [Polarella glacialis]|mmetsp:Transcript_24213/g.38783  ORF Transcript_24213/g.38783 Transcript_24213/m.38783 type:complete len:118 (+) Transcript_24213:118-471(+)